MKKILSFLAAGALALGLIGCSGDLHDDEFNPIDTSKFETFELCGAMTDWKNDAGTNLKFTPTENAYEYSVTFTAKDAEQGFCFITKTGLWDDYQIGGESMKAGTLPEGISFSSKAGEGKHEDAILSGLTANAVYKMTVETSSGVYVVSLASTEEPKYFLLDGFFITGKGIGKDGSTDADWKQTADTLVCGGVKDAASGNVTYTVHLYATSTTAEFGVANKDWANKYCGATALTVDGDAVELTKDGGENNKVTGLISGRPYDFIITTTVDGKVSLSVVQVKYIDVVGFKVVNYSGDAEILYFLNAWIPGNKWGWDTPNKGTVSAKTASCSITSTRITADTINVQITDPVIADGAERPTSGDTGFWASKVADDKVTVDNPKDFKKYIIVFDCNTSEFTLEAPTV